MSRIQTVRVKLERCDKYVSRELTKATEGMDEYELSEYCADNSVFYKNGWWEIVRKEEFEEYGFTEIISKDQSSIEFITQFYNGGTCLSEIIEGVLNGTK